MIHQLNRHTHKSQFLLYKTVKKNFSSGKNWIHYPKSDCKILLSREDDGFTKNWKISRQLLAILERKSVTKLIVRVLVLKFSSWIAVRIVAKFVTRKTTSVIPVASIMISVIVPISKLVISIISIIVSVATTLIISVSTIFRKFSVEFFAITTIVAVFVSPLSLPTLNK